MTLIRILLIRSCQHSWNIIIITILLKTTLVLKGDGSCIDLIRTNRKYCFKNTSSFETGISDHHHLIYSILKATFEKEESKKFTYRNYKQFQWENFEKDLISSLRNCNGMYENYEQNFIKVLNTDAPKKEKYEGEIINLIITKILERLS